MPARWLIVPFEKIESLVPKKGVIVDLGCGEGVMACLLAISSPKRKVIGIDINSDKIELAKSLNRSLPNVSFKKQSALEELPRTSAFILSDFLHHLPKKDHSLLFKSMKSKLENNGVILIKEIDTEDKIRAKVSRLFDLLFYPNDKINFLSSIDLKKNLIDLGFNVKIIKLKKWFPGSTTLFVCTNATGRSF